MIDSTDAVGPLGDGSFRTRQWPPLPVGPCGEQWRARAAEAAAVLAVGAAERDRSGEPPHAEVELLKEAGLVTLLGPAVHGGGGQPWSVAHAAVRVISAADGSIGHLLAHHYAWVWLAEFIGTEEKIEHIGEVAVRAKWLFGGPSRVREATLEIGDAGVDMVFNGEIADPVGCRVCDIVMLEGRIPGREVPISALAMATEPGFGLAAERDGFGLRRSVSARVAVDDVAIPWTGALGHVDKQFQPRPYNEFLHPTLDLALANVFLGLARGALDVSAAHLRADAGRTDGAFGSLVAWLWQAEAFADEVAAEGDVLHARRTSVTERDLRAHRARVTAALDRASAAAAGITSRVFDVTSGDDAVMAEVSRLWRDVRALSARVAPDAAEVGRSFLDGTCRTDIEEPEDD
ncbi:acyl-CoA dehydrogenase family protein [Saccharopolyspora hirsuta]|uniref:acyl-CoA dehydrogenase family protein n=1 Tax=Saccharopolyspora hirsuta TaxID=1837 RepID=UPI00332667D0